MASGGTALYSYYRYTSPAAFYRVADPINGLGPVVALPDEFMVPFSVINGGFVALATTFHPGSPQIARALQISSSGAVVRSAPVELPTAGYAGSASGAFALLYYNYPVEQTPTVVFHDETFQAVTHHVEFARNVPPGTLVSQEQWAFSAALTPNGTFWLPWSNRHVSPVEFYLTMLKPFTPGDLDGDGRLTNFDIDPFVAALVDRAGFAARYPAVPVEAVDVIGDMNGDSLLNNLDIDPFVEALLHVGE